MRKIINTILQVLIGINFLYALEGVLRYGLRSVDAWGDWLFKAKAFYFTNPIAALSNPLYLSQHPQYPIGLPWLISLFYKISGGVNEMPVLLAYPFIYLLILFIAYIVIRKMGVDKTLAFLFVYLYSMFSPLLAAAGRKHPGEADIFIVLAGWLIIWAIQHSKSRLSVLIIAVASQIKLEGLFLISGLITDKEKIFKKGLLIIISVIPFLIWMYVRNIYKIPQDYGFQLPEISIIPGRVWVIVYGTVKEMLKFTDWYVFWMLFWLAIVIKKSQRNWVKFQISRTAILMGFLFALVYLTTNSWAQLDLTSSIDRVLMQITPFVYVIWIDRLFSPTS